MQSLTFLSPAAGRASVQGIDVSKFTDDTDFVTAYACGARFAYIQLSAGTDQTDHNYRVYWPNARSAGLLAGPYHSVRVDPATAQAWLAARPGARPAIFQQMLQGVPAVAQGQAALFLARLNEVISSETKTGANAAGVQLPPIALDVTSDPLPAASAADKAEFGQVYAAVTCAVAAAIRANPKVGGATIVLFADPAVYAAYGLGRGGCGLDKTPVWIAYHTIDGGSYDEASAAGDKPLIDQLCRPGGAADRCVMQQYTSAGVLAVFQASAHLHMDRYLGTAAQFHAFLQPYR